MDGTRYAVVIHQEAEGEAYSLKLGRGECAV